MIANGWLDAEDYYRALAQNCGATFRAKLPAAEIATAATASPRQSLASGLLKERARERSFVFAPERLRPNALRAMLARLSPYEFSLASPHAVRGAICRHFAPSFAHHAVEGLASRRPAHSARTPLALWQRLVLIVGAIAMLAAVALAPQATLLAVSAVLTLLFVPLIGFRLLAAHGLFASWSDGEPVRSPRVPDHELPIYTLLVPLYREAHMLPPLIEALARLDYRPSSTSRSCWRPATRRRSRRRARSVFPACSRSSWCRSYTLAPSRRRSTTRCRSPAANMW
jgi:hypothetical protein